MKANSKSIRILLAALLFASLPARTAEIEQVFEEMSEIEEPFSLRDPFQAPKLKKKAKRESTTPIRKGVFTNVPQLGQVSLDDIKITGVLIGPERRAFVKTGKGNITYTLKEGMTLGTNNAEIKAILPGGVILVEKITNIYGDLEYLETVIPISK